MDKLNVVAVFSLIAIFGSNVFAESMDLFSPKNERALIMIQGDDDDDAKNLYELIDIEAIEPKGMFLEKTLVSQAGQFELTCREAVSDSSKSCFIKVTANETDTSIYGLDKIIVITINGDDGKQLFDKLKKTNKSMVSSYTTNDGNLNIETKEHHFFLTYDGNKRSEQ